MSKLLFFAAMLGVTLSTSGQAVYDFRDNVFYAPIYEESATPLGVFYSVSPNGQYAVGCDDHVMNCMESYLWSRDCPDSLMIINATANRMSAIDVSDSGTVVGSYENRGDDLGTKAVTYPAVRSIDGTWTVLPVPDTYSEYQARNTSSFADEARAITPDDKYIAGNVHLVVGYNSTWNTDIVYRTPLLWELTDTGYVIKEVYSGLGDAGKSYLYRNGELVLQEEPVNYTTFLVYDISRDGSTICGVNTAGSGGQNPSIIKDGVLIQLFDCGSYGITDYDSLNFNGGICNSIDANGNVYGYYVDFDSSVKYFVYTNENKIVYYDKWYVCAAADGTLIPQSNDMIAYVEDCSDDGMIVAGGGETTLPYGASANYPVIIDYAATPTGVERIKAIKSNISITYNRGSMLYINGEYDKAEVFNASGTKVAQGRQGKAFNMSGMPSDTYLIKVESAGGDKTFKVVK